jgi:hypothetical protein
MTILFQHVATFKHIYPLPMHALGVNSDLPFEDMNGTGVTNYARCSDIVVAQVVRITRPKCAICNHEQVDISFEILDGDCEAFAGLCDGNHIVADYNLAPGPHRMLVAENLLQLVFATGVSLNRMVALEEMMHRPFLMSVAVPCH